VYTDFDRICTELGLSARGPIGSEPSRIASSPNLIESTTESITSAHITLGPTRISDSLWRETTDAVPSAASGSSFRAERIDRCRFATPLYASAGRHTQTR